MDNFPMFFQGFSEYKDVIQIYHYNSFRDQVIEDAVHHGLKGGWAISQSKEHNPRFIEASVGSECCLPLISDLHTNIIETPMDIKFSEVFGPLEFIDKLRDEGERVLIFHRDIVESSIILYESKGAIFLFDEKDWRCHWRFKGSDASCF